MPSTYSPNVLFELQATGENNGTWGVKANADFSIADLRFGGRLNLSVAGSSDVTLTDTQARNVYHNLTGLLTGNISYKFPAAAGGFYAIKNATTGAFTVTVKPTGGTGIAVTQGTTVWLFIDPDQTSAVLVAQPLLASASGLEYSSGALRRAALTGDVTAPAGSNATTLGITTIRGDVIYRGASANTRLAIGAANSVLTSNGTDPVWAGVGALVAIQTFVVNGTYTPSAGVTKALAIITGGGGGGGGSASAVIAGGGGGSGVTNLAFLTTPAVLAVTVGAAGTGGSGNVAGSNGGLSSLGTRTAGGGNGGAANGGGALGGSGGTVSANATLAISGGYGGSGNATVGGQGGSSFWGGGSRSDAGGLTPALAYGAGGGGGTFNSSTPTTGNDGKAGVVMILEFA